MKAKILIILCAIALSGCVSVPVPSPGKNTLLTGKFLVNWNTSGEMSGGNGKYRSGIQFYIENPQTGKVISASTQKDGWLLVGKLPEAGHYTITKLLIYRETSTTNYTVTLNGPFLITVEEGLVNNLGTVQIDLGDNSYTHQLVDYDSVKYDFAIDFPDSEWNTYEWKNIFGFN